MIRIDLKNGKVILEDERGISVYPMDTPEAFSLLSEAWLRCGFDNKYVYSFSWLGRPILQLPEDLIRVQEAVFTVQPDVLIEIGVAHGGSLVFYASLFKAMGKGRVIGIDIEIRPHNRKTIENHFLYPWITLIEGDSTANEVLNEVKSLLKPSDKVMVVLDSKHSKDHVLGELWAYADLVSDGSYILALDGVMEGMSRSPRGREDWVWNNPKKAAEEFLCARDDFILERPLPVFNEGNITEGVTYWTGAWLKKVGSSSKI